MTTLETIQKLIADKFELQASELETAPSLEALGIDSLAVTEFMFDLEDEFKIKIPYAPVEIKTLQDIAAIVDRLVLEQHGSAG
jgi:acyl carrier protein